MMNYREIFEAALSGAYSSASCSDSGRLFDIVTERAKAPAKKSTALKRNVIIAVVIAAAVLICGGFAVFGVIFYTDSTSDPYFINFSAAANSAAPVKIEHYYSISFPEGFYPDSTQRMYCTDTLYSVSYTDGNDGHITFAQYAINSFSIGYEKDTFEIVNNFADKTIDLHIIDGKIMTRLWTDGNYIYEVTAAKELFGLIELKKLHEVYPEVHDLVYYWG